MVKVLSALDWAVIISYFLVVFVIGNLSAKKQSGDRSFFLGDRQMPVWAVSISIIATSLSAVTFLGSPQEAFKGDLSYLILNIGGIISAFIVAYFFVPIFFRTNTLTIYGYLEKRFGLRTRIVSGIAFLIGRLLASGARLFIAALGASILFNGSAYPTSQQLILLILLIGISGTIYTVFGGIRAVIWTDVIQFSVVMLTVGMTIYFLVSAIPLSIPEMASFLSSSPTAQEGFSKLSLVHMEWDLSSPYTLLTGTFAIIFLNVACYGVDHDIVQRMLTCKTPWQGGLSLISSIFLGIVVVFLFMCIGLLLYLFSRPEIMGESAAMFNHSELIYPQFLISYLPEGFSGLAIAGLFAVAMGSLDSAINAMASSAIADVWRPIKKTFFGKNTEEMEQGLKRGRISVALIGAALMLFAVLAALSYDPKNNTLLGFSLGIMTYAYSGLLGVFLTGIFTKRGNTISCICAMVAGPIIVFLLQPSFIPRWLGVQIAWPWWMVLGSLVSMLISAAGSAQKETSVIRISS